ncbi:MAG: DUF5615 family PIN-like protein [Dehalococcoidia bacterium]
MRFLVDSMFPSDIASDLNARGHDAVTPDDIGAHNLPDDVLIEIATAEQRVIVTENASDFAHVTTCPVLFVRKSWWPPKALAAGLAAALDRWAGMNADPGSWPHWLEEEFR